MQVIQRGHFFCSYLFACKMAASLFHGEAITLHGCVFLQLKDDVGKMLASEYPGGQVTTHLASFSSPQFTKVQP